MSHEFTEPRCAPVHIHDIHVRIRDYHDIHDCASYS